MPRIEVSQFEFHELRPSVVLRFSGPILHDYTASLMMDAKDGRAKTIQNPHRMSNCEWGLDHNSWPRKTDGRAEEKAKALSCQIKISRVFVECIPKFEEHSVHKGLQSQGSASQSRNLRQNFDVIIVGAVDNAMGPYQMRIWMLYYNFLPSISDGAGSHYPGNTMKEVRAMSS